jgi:hypothetical protein
MADRYPGLRTVGVVLGCAALVCAGVAAQTKTATPITLAVANRTNANVSLAASGRPSRCGINVDGWHRVYVAVSRDTLNIAAPVRVNARLAMRT